MKHTVAAFSQILGQQMEASNELTSSSSICGKHHGEYIDSLQFIPSNQEGEHKNGFETNEEDYELIPGKVAQ